MCVEPILVFFFFFIVNSMWRWIYAFWFIDDRRFELTGWMLMLPVFEMGMPDPRGASKSSLAPHAPSSSAPSKPPIVSSRYSVGTEVKFILRSNRAQTSVHLRQFLVSSLWHNDRYTTPPPVACFERWWLRFWPTVIVIWKKSPVYKVPR